MNITKKKKKTEEIQSKYKTDQNQEKCEKLH